MSRLPGDVLIDRYFADAGEAERETTREEFKRFVQALLNIAVRLAQEQSTQADSPKVDGRRRIPPSN